MAVEDSESSGEVGVSLRPGSAMLKAQPCGPGVRLACFSRMNSFCETVARIFVLYSSQSSRFRVSKGEGKALSLDRLRY